MRKHNIECARHEEAKSANFDIKAMKKILKLRKMDESDRQEEEFIESLDVTPENMVSGPVFYDEEDEVEKEQNTLRASTVQMLLRDMSGLQP